jgi:hypothetical protein
MSSYAAGGAHVRNVAPCCAYQAKRCLYCCCDVVVCKFSSRVETKYTGHGIRHVTFMNIPRNVPFVFLSSQRCSTRPDTPFTHEIRSRAHLSSLPHAEAVQPQWGGSRCFRCRHARTAKRPRRRCRILVRCQSTPWAILCFLGQP